MRQASRQTDGQTDERTKLSVEVSRLKKEYLIDLDDISEKNMLFLDILKLH